MYFVTDLRDHSSLMVWGGGGGGGESRKLTTS